MRHYSAKQQKMKHCSGGSHLGLGKDMISSMGGRRRKLSSSRAAC